MEERKDVVLLGLKPVPYKLTKEAPSYEHQKRGRQRLDVFKKNLGKLYVYLFQGMYGGEVLKDSHGHSNLFPLLEERGARWDPDIFIENGTLDTYVEVKATSRARPRPLFGFRQYCGTTLGIVENPMPVNMLAAIFQYERLRKENFGACNSSKFGRHPCDSRCLVERVAESTGSLLVLPHNLLTFLFLISRKYKLNQQTSQSRINSETYIEPFCSWLTWLRQSSGNPSGVIEQIMDYPYVKGLPEVPNPEDFFISGLTARKINSSELFDGNLVALTKKKRTIRSPEFAMKPFPVIIYENPSKGEWFDYFRKHYQEILINLGAYETYQELLERRKKRRSRRGRNERRREIREEKKKKKEAEKQQLSVPEYEPLPETPEDGIPI